MNPASYLFLCHSTWSAKSLWILLFPPPLGVTFSWNRVGRFVSPVPGVFLSETPSGTVQGLLDVPSVDTSDQVLGPSRPHQGYPWKDLSIVLVSH